MAAKKGSTDIPYDHVLQLAAFGLLAKTDVDLATEFCTAVRFICYAEDGDSVRNACRETGVLSIVLQCITAYPGDTDLITAALCACNNMLSSGSAGNATEFIRLDGLRIFYDAIASRLHDAMFARMVCSVTWQITNHASCRKAVDSSGGLFHVRDAMKAHPSNEVVQEHGCYALRNLAEAYLIKDVAGVVEVAQKARRTHARIASVVAAADDALTTMGVPSAAGAAAAAYYSD